MMAHHRFGKNNRYATFPSVSLGWRINQEKFLKSAQWLNDLKLRASWGATGNQEISNIARYTIYVSNYGVNENGGQSYGTSYDIAGTNGGRQLPSGFKRDQLGNNDINGKRPIRLILVWTSLCSNLHSMEVLTGIIKRLRIFSYRWLVSLLWRR